MCGIVLLFGPRAAERLPQCLRRLRHRGPDDQAQWIDGDLALGFTRLAINGGETSGRQPYEHGERIAAINGEIYNAATLTRAHGLEESACDTRVVLPLFALLGPRVIDTLDGFYSAVIVDPLRQAVTCLRDHIGKKPLFVGRSGTEMFIASELKIFDRCERFEPLPRGASIVDLATGAVQVVAEHRPVEPPEDLGRAFASAVKKRLPSPGQPLGVFLSGGLDSSLVAAHVCRFRDDATYFTLGNPDGLDHRAVKTVAEALGLGDVRTIPLPGSEELPELIRTIVFATESFNPSIVSNGLSTYLLARAARQAGIKVVLSGEGADELFGGYHAFRAHEPWADVRAQLIEDMPQTELRRLDLSCMANSVEARCPFLDRAVRRFSDGLEHAQLYGDGHNKVALRTCFEGELPPEILHRRKMSFDVGSGMRARIVRYLIRNGRRERDELKRVWQEQFTHDASDPYFHAYPVFDAAIDVRAYEYS